MNERIPHTQMQTLTALGKGSYRYFSLLIYDATLYAEPKALTLTRLHESHFALALRYARELSGEKIAERSDAEMGRQPGASESERRNWLSQMKALFPNVKKGDVLLGLHAPGKGTRFYLNAQLLGTIEGENFARYFFGIWLAETTSAPELRQALLNSPAALVSQKAQP